MSLLYNYGKQRFLTDLSLNGTTELTGQAILSGSTTISGATTISGSTTHTAATTFSGAGKTQFNADASFNQALTIAGATTVSGKSQFNADVSLNGITTAGKTQFISDVSLNGHITTTVDGKRFTSTGNSRFTSADTFATYLNNDKATSGDLYINSGSLNSNVIVQNGSLAIGKTTISNGVKLDVSGGSISLSNPSPSIVLKPGTNQAGTWWGIQAPVTGGINIGTVNGSEVMSAPTMCLLNNGNVGIGTASPTDKLHIHGGNIRMASNTAIITNYIIGDDATSLYIQSGYQNATSMPRIGILGYTSAGVGDVNRDNVIKFDTNGSNRMIINQSGNVGIGTSSPEKILDIYGAQPQIKMKTTGGAGYGHIMGFQFFNTSFPDVQGAIYSVEDQLAGGTWGSSMRFETYYDSGSAERMRISNNGNVGIGTTNVKATLHVYGSGSNVLSTNDGLGYWFTSTNSANTIQSGNTKNFFGTDLTLVCSNGVAATFYAAYSDKRIKTNIVDIDDEKALSILRQIQPKTYDYVDKLQRGNANVIGFIAQEIKDILPKAVSITKDYIPNFMTLCQVSATDASNIVLVTSPIDLSWNPHHDQSGNAFVDAEGNACSDASGNKVFKLKLYDQSNNIIDCKTTSILDKRSFLMDVTSSKMIDASGNLQLENNGEYFLHGQEVDDFHNIDKQAIFTVVTAAVQDIDRQVQAQAVKQQADEAKIAALESQVASLEARLAAIEQMLAK